jgi:hemerythrin
MIKVLTWSPELATGIQVIDDQHRQLLSHAGEALEALGRRDRREVIERTLSFLMSYVRYHFASEESHMLRLRYPRLEEHRAEHRDYLRRLEALRSHFEGEGDSPAVSMAVDSLLGAWLLDHIGRTDRDFAEHARTAGA